MKKMKIMKKIVLLAVMFFLLGISSQYAEAKTAAPGKLLVQNGHRMFLKKDGTYAKNTWVQTEKGRYLFNEKGYAHFGMVDWKGNTYYIRRNGGMYTGWKKYRGDRYYFKTNGKMVKGRWMEKGGKSYYMEADGKMAVGWKTIGSRTYYLGTDGAKVTGEQWIDGKGCYFSKRGVYNPDKKVKYDPSKPMVALTFDDGPGPYTNRLLDCLKKNDAVATFFVVGNSISRYPDVVKRASRLGCEIGSHTWDHPQLTTLSADGIRSQIDRTNSQLQSVIGKNASVMRPPYGSYNTNVLANVKAPAILWSIDTRDWEHRNADRTISIVMSQVKDGDIILMHDIHSTSVDAAERLIPMLKAKGYQLVTVSELAKYKGQTLQTGNAYRSIT